MKLLFIALTFLTFGCTVKQDGAAVEVPQPLPTVLPKRLSLQGKSPALVVYNENAPGAQDLAGYYAKKRTVVESNICPVKMPLGDYATWDQMLGARKRIIEKCLCPLFQEIQPCTEASAEKLSQITWITHLVLIQGIPHRLTQTGMTTDFEDPSLDAYLSASIYHNLNSFLIDALGRIDLTTLTSAFANPANSYWAPLHPKNNKLMAFGRIEGLSMEAAKRTIDRTIEAEELGVTGKFYTERDQTYVSNPAQHEHDDVLSHFLRDITNTSTPECFDYLAANGTWPTSCRVGETPSGIIPGLSSSIPVVFNASLFLGSEAFTEARTTLNNQRAFNGNFSGMLKWRKNNDANCTPLCAQLASIEEREMCRQKSTDHFKELNTDCVGVGRGFIGMQFRSYSVMNYSVYPQGWSTLSAGEHERSHPQIIRANDAFKNDRFTDNAYIRFGSRDNAICESANGIESACATLLPIEFETFPLLPAPLAIGTPITLLYKFRYRNSASVNGKIHVYTSLYDDGAEGHQNTKILDSVLDLSVPHEEWTEVAITLDVLAGDYTTAYPAVRANLRFSSKFQDQATGFFEVDGVEIQMQEGSHLLTADLGSFSAPLVNNLVGGDWAANVIDRLGGIAFWGSGSHHLTGGGAFARQLNTAGAFFAGFTLGESVLLGDLIYSGTIYGDPLYRPVAVQLHTGEVNTTVRQMMNPETVLQPRWIYRDPEAQKRVPIYVRAYNGSNHLETVRWKLEKCLLHDNFLNCDTNSAWSLTAQGVGAQFDSKITPNVLDLLPQNFSGNFFLRLKVWNPNDEEHALYSRMAFKIVNAPSLNSRAGVFVSGSSWRFKYSLPANQTVGINGVDRLQIQLHPGAAVPLNSILQVKAYGVQQAEYQLTYLSENAGVAHYAISPPVTYPEKIAVKITKGADAALRFLRILPGNNPIVDNNDNELYGGPTLNEEDSSMIFTDIQIFSALTSYEPNLIRDSDVNGDNVLDQADLDFLSAQIAAGKTALPPGEPMVP